jgi:hypothetical protein
MATSKSKGNACDREFTAFFKSLKQTI